MVLIKKRWQQNRVAGKRKNAERVTDLLIGRNAVRKTGITVKNWQNMQQKKQEKGANPVMFTNAVMENTGI